MTGRHRVARTTLAARAALAMLVAGLLAGMPARAGTLQVRDADGSQWSVDTDTADNANDWLLLHIDAALQPDPRFGHAGQAAFSLTAANDAPTSLRVEASGHRIWMVGIDSGGTPPRTVVARFLADGSPDPRWGVQGKMLPNPNGEAVKARDLLPLSDGSVLVAGETPGRDGPQATVFHLKADGTLDAAFGTRGVWHRPGPESAFATSLAAAPDGSVAVAIAVHGAKGAAELWSLGGGAPTLIQQSDADLLMGQDDLRTEWVGGRWAINPSGGPTRPVGPASLTPVAATAATAASGPASDPGQGAFNPFAADAPASDAPPAADDGLPWPWIGLAAVLLSAILALLFRRRGGKNGKKAAARDSGRR